MPLTRKPTKMGASLILQSCKAAQRIAHRLITSKKKKEKAIQSSTTILEHYFTAVPDYTTKCSTLGI